MAADLFVSYARKDRDQVLPWLQQLQEAGVSLWLDEQDIDGAHLWTGEITQAIRACRVLALLLSPASAASEQVLREVTLALEEHKPILPLLLEPVEIPATLRYPLAGLQQIELFRGDPEAKRTALLRALTRLGVAAPAWQTAAPATERGQQRAESARPRHNLPQALTRFIGREQEIEAATEQLSRSRLLTLTGIGGLGKTRLGLEVARAAAPDYLDGVWLVELAALAEPGLVPQQVAIALGVREEPGRPLVETLTDYLQPRQLLLVLDNCEHLVAACADLVQRLLQACPDLRVLATSREALGVPGEQLFRLPTLAAPVPPPPPLEQLTQYEAVRLFIDRAQISQPSFAVTNANAPAVAGICHRLDGIPLALELAASRVKLLSMEQLLARLEDRFKLLTGGSRTVLPRQQTLRAAIDWSHELLTEAERVLLRRLSVFAGGFTLEAAEAIGPLGQSDRFPRRAEPQGAQEPGSEAVGVAELLGRLVDKSLVLAEEGSGERRYRLLETIRAYGEEKLSGSPEEPEIRRWHRDWYLGLAEAAEGQLEGPDQGTWLERLEREHDNLREALEWVAERGQTDQGWWGRRLLRRFCPRFSSLGVALRRLAVSSEVDAGLRLAGALSTFYEVRGYLSEGRNRLAQFLSLAGEAPRRNGGLGGLARPENRPNAAATLSRLGWGLLFVYFVMVTKPWLLMFLLLILRVGTPLQLRLWPRGYGVGLLAMMSVSVASDSLELLASASHLSRPLMLPILALWLVYLMPPGILLYLFIKSWRTSLKARSLQSANALSRGWWRRGTLWWFLAVPPVELLILGCAATLASLLVQVRLLTDESYRFDSQRQFILTLYIGLLPYLIPSFVATWDRLLATLLGRAGSTRMRVLAKALHRAGELAHAQGDVAEAVARYRHSLDIYQLLSSIRGISLLLNSQGTMNLRQGNSEAARALYEMNLVLSLTRDDKHNIATALHSLGALSLYEKKEAFARSLYAEALEIRRELRDQSGTASSLEGLAKVALLEGGDGARVLYAESLMLRRELGDRAGMAACLEGIAVVAGELGHPERTARLLGAAEALRQAIGSPLAPSDRAEYDRHVAATRAALDEATFAAAWAEGRALPLEQAIALALAPAQPPVSPPATE